LNYELLYQSLYQIRKVELEIARIYPTDKIKSPVHLSIGQESISVGVCQNLQEQDIVFGSYRSHAMYLAKGGDLNKMIAELYGKATGCAKGKGGSMHLVDMAKGIMGTSAVVGTTIPNAVGYAYGIKQQKLDKVVISFFGDGATEEGVFYESLNFAALKQLPIIFVCENNGYAIHTHQSARQANMDICKRVESFGIPAHRINDDILQIHDAMRDAIDNVRNNHSGPAFFECMTYRWKEHVGPNEDFNMGYRDIKEAEPWFQNDQVERLGTLLTPNIRTKIESSVNEAVDLAFAFAEESPFPEPAELTTDIFMET